MSIWKACPIKRALLGMIICIAVLVMYFTYSGDLPFTGFTSVTKAQVRLDSLGSKTFKFSTNGIFKTILGIKDKNCRLSNQHESNGQRLKCRKLATCNVVKTTKPNLPATCKQRLPGCIIIGVFKAGTREF